MYGAHPGPWPAQDSHRYEVAAEQHKSFNDGTSVTQGEPSMGKHAKEVDCGMCGGSGRIVTTDDGKRREIPCTGCNGSGKQ